MIRFDDISLGFNGRLLFQNLSFSVGQGEKFCISGASGSGKSTLLELIMGFRQPDSGSVFLWDKKVSAANIKKLRNQMSWLPQNVNILGNTSVAGLIDEIFSHSKNMHIKPKPEELESNLAQLGLGKEILNQSFESISGGEKQRIGLIIAKLLQRKLMLLDEPTSALDQDSIGLAIDYINKDNTATVISVSHDSRWILSSDNVLNL